MWWWPPTGPAGPPNSPLQALHSKLNKGTLEENSFVHAWQLWSEHEISLRNANRQMIYRVDPIDAIGIGGAACCCHKTKHSAEECCLSEWNFDFWSAIFKFKLMDWHENHPVFFGQKKFVASWHQLSKRAQVFFTESCPGNFQHLIAIALVWSKIGYAQYRYKANSSPAAIYPPKIYGWFWCGRC